MHLQATFIRSPTNLYLCGLWSKVDPIYLNISLRPWHLNVATSIHLHLDSNFIGWYSIAISSLASNSC
jgi:hypothetical protein